MSHLLKLNLSGHFFIHRQTNPDKQKHSQTKLSAMLGKKVYTSTSSNIRTQNPKKVRQEGEQTFT